MERVFQFLLDSEDPSDPSDPGLPTGQAARYQGPWFSTQLTLSLTIGLASFLFFCFARRVERWKVLYSPRTLLKGFSPHEVHDKNSFFGWILPTLRTSEFTVLQIVGLDAAVLLSFFRTAFLFFLTCTILAGGILVPINYRENGTSEGVPPLPNSTYNTSSLLLLSTSSLITLPMTKPIAPSNLYLTTHLLFTYLFTLLALIFLQRNYAKFIPMRQLFSLELADSIPARTVMCTELPAHLRSERALAEYFEGIRLGHTHTGGGGGDGDPGMGNGRRTSSSSSAPSSSESVGLGVESVTVTRAVGGMKELLERRTAALRELEEEWAKYLGNPVPVEGKKAVFGYNAERESEAIWDEGGRRESAATADQNAGEGDNDDAARRRRTNGDVLVDLSDDTPFSPTDDIERALLHPSYTPLLNPTRPRPRFRPNWFSFGEKGKVDKLDWLAERFRDADEDVKRRRKGKFRPTGVAFVTFETLAGAQIAAQTVHYPSATAFHTELAPEPRDIHWFNLSLSPSSAFIRKVLVLFTLLVLLSVWSVPVAYLSRLLSWDSIEEAAPRLAEWIGRSPRARGFVQTTLPSLALVGFNNFLPFFLEAMSVFQGLPARSWIEYSTLKKYHVSLLFTVLFVFITFSTYVLLQDISKSPQQVLDRLATALPQNRNFFIAYVMLSSLALMPLQLLELPVIIPRVFFSLFFTRTPRDHAELNSPSGLNLGTVYPQALLIFTIGITYSIITPIILPFATLYFGLAYLVYKYKLLFVYYRPYESRGQAWPLAFVRMGWGLLIFQIFMLGLFTIRQAFLLSVLMIPLLFSTAYAIYRIYTIYHPLSRFVNLSQACEVSSGSAGMERTGDITRLRKGHPVTRSQSNLNRRRYAHNDEGIYVVGKNPATDYAQPPLSESYPGVLNTGRRRYGHPALSGALPEPWLPVLAVPKQEQEVPDIVKDALVLDLRRRWSRVKRAAAKATNVIPGVTIPISPAVPSSSRSDDDDPSRAWRGGQSPIENDFSGIFSDDDEDLEDGPGMSRYSTYWAHPERRRGGRQVPGSFPPGPGDATDDTDDESLRS